MSKTELAKMIAGELYQPADEQLTAMRIHARKMTRAYNETEVEDLQGRQVILKKLLGSTTDNFYIEPPFQCDYGSNIQWGDNSYANFNLVILDIAPVTIGKNVMFAPNVTISAATHPLIASERNSGFEYGKPVIIGDNVWFGSGVIVNPGVTIGDNAVIGAGSVVV
ncbi:MAG: sugar O-acetyltransferase, partial [Culicoidibacterales bacterium]